MAQENSELRDELLEKDTKIAHSAAKLLSLAEENSDLKRVIVQQEIRFCNLQAPVAEITVKQSKPVDEPVIIPSEQPSCSGVNQIKTKLAGDTSKVDAASSDEKSGPDENGQPISEHAKERTSDSTSTYVEFSSITNPEEAAKKSTKQTKTKKDAPKSGKGSVSTMISAKKCDTNTSNRSKEPGNNVNSASKPDQDAHSVSEH